MQVKLSSDFIKKRYEDVSEASSEHIATLRNLLGCIDMTTDEGRSKAHCILDIVGQVQATQVAMETLQK